MAIRVIAKSVCERSAPVIAGTLRTPVIIVILAVLAALGVLLEHYK